LAEVVRRLVPQDGSLSVIVARRLADLLHEPGLAHPTLVTLFTSVMAAESRIELDMALDLQAVRNRDPACSSSLQAVLNFKGFQALQAHRIAQALWHGGQGELASRQANHASMVLGRDIHPAARLGAGTMLDQGSGIVIGETAVVDDDVSILQNVTLGGTGKELGARHPVIRRGVIWSAYAATTGAR
jgi:serine O-acetyltransferase